MRGFLDDLHQPFLTIDFGQGPLDFMVDTGFSDALLVGEERFDRQRAKFVGDLSADMVGEHRERFDVYSVDFIWLGEMSRVPVLVGPGTDCLIGTKLLHPHRLEIDFEQRIVELIRSPNW